MQWVANTGFTPILEHWHDLSKDSAVSIGLAIQRHPDSAGSLSGIDEQAVGKFDFPGDFTLAGRT
jgi:hypothetical protein